MGETRLALPLVPYRNDHFKNSTLSFITSLPKKLKTKNMKDHSFFENVYQVVRLIPKGRVSSYGAIGAAIGSRKSARMVGYAMNNSHGVEPFIPAHRVVNRKGLLTGRHHFSPPELMEELLKAEGIEIKDNQVQNFKEVFWDPIDEIQF